jgi:hypothetical protein
MSKYYQITEEDLAVLESELPRILDATAMSCNDPLMRKRWEAVKSIISNVRWDYGPPLEVHLVDGEQQGQQ